MALPENGALRDAHRFGARETLPSAVPGARQRPGRLLWAHSDYQVPESANEDTLEEPRSLALRGHGCLGRDCIDTLAGCAALGGAGTLLRCCWSSCPHVFCSFRSQERGKREPSPPSLALGNGRATASHWLAPNVAPGHPSGSPLQGPSDSRGVGTRRGWDTPPGQPGWMWEALDSQDKRGHQAQTTAII